MKRAYSYIQARIPTKYRTMMTKCPGQLFKRCTSGQTSFTLALSKASSTDLLVWVNPTSSYSGLLRGDALTTTQWSLSSQTLTLSVSISQDDWVVVEYSHDGSGLTPSADTSDRSLFQAILKRSAFEVGQQRFQEVKGGEIPAYIQTYGDEVDGWIGALQNGEAGIPIFDDVELYEDWEGPSKGIYTAKLRRG